MRFPVYSRTGAYVGDIPHVSSAVRTRNVDGTDQLELSCIGIDLQKDDRVLVKCRDAWREYAVLSVSRERAASAGALVAVCRNSVAELSRKYIVEREGRSYTATQALDKAIEGTRWARGTVDAPGTHDVSFYHQSALKSLEDVCAAYACELDATVEVEGSTVKRRLVHLRARIGSGVARRRFEYSRDLVSIKRTVAADDVVTRLYPWGKGVETEGGGYSRKIGIADVNGGKPYVEDTEATRRFGIPDANGVPQPNEGSWEDGNIDDPSVLLKEAKKRLRAMCAPRVSYEAEVAVMERAGDGIEGAECGDAVQIVDTAFEPPLRLEGRILETSEDLVGDLSRSKIKLGNIVESYTRRNQRVEAAVQKLTGSAGAWDDAASLGGGYLNGIVDGLNAVLNETGGYTYLKPGEGIYVYDKPEDQEPTQCIQIGGGYFRVANGKRSDGQWDFRTIGTGSGLVADSLYTGTIEGGANTWNLDTGDVLFRQGGIRDAKDRNYWNLDTGEFKLSSSGTTIDGKKPATADKAIQAVDVEYASGLSSTTPPLSGWSTTAPAWSAGRYIWQRTKTTAQDGSATYSDPTCIQGAIGEQGVGIESIAEQYYLSGSSTSLTGGSWSSDQPQWAKYKYIWTRSRITWEDRTVTFTEPVLARALNGANQSASEAKDSVTQLDNSLTQREIFNRLTNNGQTQGIYLSGGKLYLNGEYIKAGTVVTDRLQTSRGSDLYAKIGTTANGNPGASFHKGSYDYLDIEAMYATEDPSKATSGVGLSVNNKGFLSASRYYTQTWITTPSFDDYIRKPSEQLYLRSGSGSYVELQRNEDQGVFFGDGWTKLSLDKTHYVYINSTGVQCRCGSKGFGWDQGRFFSELTW